MDVVFVIGRVMLVQMFIMGGLLFHLGQRQSATQTAKDMGVPLATIGVPLTGIANVVGGLMVVLGAWVTSAHWHWRSTPSCSPPSCTRSGRWMPTNRTTRSSTSSRT